MMRQKAFANQMMAVQHLVSSLYAMEIVQLHVADQCRFNLSHGLTYICFEVAALFHLSCVV